jgi:threonyl-tRNA synthetase
MRILAIHSDYLEYEARERIKGIGEDIDEGERKKRIEEPLVVFITCESEDGKDIVEPCADEIEEIMEKVKAERVVVYPYAHLSSSLLNPKEAMEITNSIADVLLERGRKVYKAPFGWYKSFLLSCKGHPLSELSKTIAPKKKTREDVVQNIDRRFVVLTKDGREIPLEKKESDASRIEEASLRKYFLSGELGVKSAESSSFKEMQRLQIVDYEPASDSGHFRFYPNGTLMFNLLQRFCKDVSDSMGAMEIDTPVLYNWAEPDIREQTESFHERHYVVKGGESEKEFVLRFAGDFGLFRMLKDAVISYRHMPFRIYEISKSFRYEQSGELSGLKRLRAFHMPDLHSFSRGVEEAWGEFEAIFRKHVEIMEALGIEYTIAFRAVEEFYEEYKERIVGLLKQAGRDAFIEVIEKRTHYWVIKDEFQSIDSAGGSVQLCTVQLDVEDGERYGIKYTDEAGEKRYCTIVHTSVGSIERLLYSVFEDALKKEKHELEFWLAPTQMRLIPVEKEYVKDCIDLRTNLHGRIDIDDREESVARKIRDAEREWISMIVVVGENERNSGVYPVRFRSGEMKNMSVENMNSHIGEKMSGYPFESLAVPELLSRRVIFRG